MLSLRSTVFNLFFYLTLAVLLLVGLPSLALGRRAVQTWARFWARLSIRMLAAVCGTKLEFRGLHHLPRQGCLVAAKHQSFFETFALLTVAPDFTFVLKRELRSIPIFGWYLRRCGLIAIDRGKRSSALAHATRQAVEQIGAGRQFFIFPEGTRRPIGAPPDYKAGIAQIYSATGAPCIPVALNSGLFWPRRRFLRRPGTIVIEFLPPIAPGLERRDFMRRLQDQIETATCRLVEEARHADPTLRGDPAPVGRAAPAPRASA